MGEKYAEPVEFPAPVSQYGLNEPLPERRNLRAGPLTAVLEGGDLRYVKLGSDTVVLRLYAAIRDRNWGTIEPAYLSYELDDDGDGFSLRFVAENVGGDVDFKWQGSINGTPEGVITATMDGLARKSFLRNRIGWCVLHPMDLAGVVARVETPQDTVEGAFPDLISPHQPFVDMQAISYATASGEISIRFEGDLWEMEDQRNWTDASYKTYSTPLRLPYPVEIHEGDRVWQRVTIEATSGAQGHEAQAAAPGGPVRVTVDPSRGRTIPPIGLGVASHGASLADEEIALLRALRLGHLHLALDLSEPQWRESLARATREAVALDTALAIEAIAGPDGAGLGDLAETLSGSEVTVTWVLVFSGGETVTDETVLATAREAFARAGLATLVGGGTRAYFTELNRATLPLELMDVVGYTLNPQVHAFDNASITETLSAQPETVRSARAIVGDRPLVVGPITMRPRFNPNATGPDPKPSPGELPPAVDYRQPSLFAAGWLAGSIGALANAGADALAYFETTGWKGLIERRDHPLRVARFHSWPGMIFPVYHVLADIAEFQGGQMLPVTLGDGLRVQAMALREGERLRVILANMGDESLSVALEMQGTGAATIRRLDDRTVYLAATDPVAFRGSTQPIDTTNGTVIIDLPPFGLATVDGKSAGT